MSRATWIAVVAPLLATAWPSGPAHADVRRVEAVGAVAVAPDAPPGAGLRDAALRAGLREAVARVAQDLLRAEGRGGLAEQLDLEPILGEPLDYAVRYRILEDYGERARVFVTHAASATEYVVLVEAHVDEARVRAKLAQSGLVAEAARGTSSRWVRVILEPLSSYRAFAWTREALAAQGGATAVTPLELERGRAVLAARTPLRPAELGRRLVGAASDGVHVAVRDASGRTLALHVVAEPTAGSRPARAAAED